MNNDNQKKIENFTLGGGCFWCLQAIFEQVQGVEKVIAGYSGGVITDPNYEKVSSGRTGYAEVVRIYYDAQSISLEDILNIFFSIHDPTTLNRQGADVGTQYRSIILYENKLEHDTAEKVMLKLVNEKIFDGMIVTELAALENFYPAEEYHQHYFEKNPTAAYCQLVVAPKIVKFRNEYQKLFKKNSL